MKTREATIRPELPSVIEINVFCAQELNHGLPKLKTRLQKLVQVVLKHAPLQIDAFSNETQIFGGFTYNFS